ncbi:MAG: hypothetical protein K0S09_2306 [Sphingobacteriaceae bacterium]|nr:hypothetical protein [Sphingobacteriaceae bacterium]
MNSPRILIVDNEPQMMDRLTAVLAKKGYWTSSTSTQLPIPNSLQGSYFDLVAFGRSISQGVRQCYEDILRFNNPKLLALTGISPSVPVVAEQVSMALNRSRQHDQAISYINYDINEGRLAVMMLIAKECEVEISLYRTNIFYGTSEKSLFQETLSAGERFVRFEESALSGFGAKFMVIRVDGKVFYMKRL